METVIALDIGTTHLKAALFDKSGRVHRHGGGRIGDEPCDGRTPDGNSSLV